MSTPLLTRYPALSALPEADLKDLLSDDSLLQAFLYSLPEVGAVLDEHERLSRENEEIAKRNLALQPDLIALRTATTSAYTTAQHLQDRWKEVEAKQSGVYQRYRPSFLHLRLRHAMNDQDSLTEQMASDFIESPNPISGSGVGGNGSGSGTNSRVDSPAFGMSAGGDKVNGGNMSLEEFVRTFKAARKVYHKRAIWYERWTRGEVAWRED